MSIASRSQWILSSVGAARNDGQMFCAAPNGAWWIGKMDLPINVSRLKGAGAAPRASFSTEPLQDCKSVFRCKRSEELFTSCDIIRAAAVTIGFFPMFR
jgi:hypothetical protein